MNQQNKKFTQCGTNNKNHKIKKTNKEKVNNSSSMTEALHLISRPFFTYPKAMNVEDLAIKVRPQERKSQEI